MTEEQYQRWVKTNFIIREDITTEKGMIEYGLELKALEGKDTNWSSVRVIVFPKINEDE